ncbi:MAG: hypothetical protein Q4G66_10790 [bacterium]|nr:hypothetical protein [bacterium]
MKQLLLASLLLLCAVHGIAHGQSIQGQPVVTGADPQQTVYRFCRECFAGRFEQYLRPRIHLNGIALPIAIPMGVDRRAIIEQTPYGRLMTWFAAFRDPAIASSPQRLQELIALDVQLYLHGLIEDGMNASRFEGRRKISCVESGAQVLQLIMEQTDLAADWLGAVEANMQAAAVRRDLEEQRSRLRQGLIDARQLEQNLQSILKEALQ